MLIYKVPDRYQESQEGPQEEPKKRCPRQREDGSRRPQLTQEFTDTIKNKVLSNVQGSAGTRREQRAAGHTWAVTRAEAKHRKTVRQNRNGEERKGQYTGSLQRGRQAKPLMTPLPMNINLIRCTPASKREGNQNHRSCNGYTQTVVSP